MEVVKCQEGNESAFADFHALRQDFSPPNPALENVQGLEV